MNFIGFLFPTFRLKILVLLSVLFCCLTYGVESQKSYNGGTCHCKWDAQCNRTSGVCPGQCAAGFIGFTCQAENLAGRASSVELGNAHNESHGTTTRLTDGQTSSCDASLHAGYPYVRVRFSSPQTVTRVRFYTDRAFSNGKVTYFPGENDLDSNYQCQPFDWAAAANRWNIMTCGGTQQARMVQIKSTYKDWFSLSMCEVEIYDLSVRGTPDGPGDVRVSSPAQGSLQVTWSRPANTYGLAVKSYTVSYRQTKDDCGETVSQNPVRTAASGDQFSGGSSTFAVNNLKGGFEYRATVAAETDADEGGGRSPESAAARGTISATVPTAGVENLKRINKTGTSLTWSWDPPPCGHRGGALDALQYEVIIHVDRTSGWSYVESRTVSETRYSTSTTLEAYTQYTIRVKAKNSAGISSYYDDLPTRTDEGPSDPVSWRQTSSSDNSITVRWQAPSNPKGVLTDYHVRWEDHGSPDCQLTELQDPDSQDIEVRTDYTIRNLKPYRNYTVTVFPVNGAGRGHGRGTHGLTGEGSPTGKVQTLKFEVVDILSNSAEVEATWEAPQCDDRNGRIQDYRVTITNKDGTRLLGPRDTPDTSVRYNSASLGETYTVEVTYQVNGWRSSEVATDQVVVREKPPGPVGSLGSNEVSTSSLAITWTVPPSPRGTITSYMVICELVETFSEDVEEGAKWEESVPAGQPRSYRLSDAAPGSSYTCSVVPVNGAGQGNVSHLTVLTPALKPPTENLVAPESSPYTNTTVKVTIQPTPFYGGPLHHVIVVKEESSRSRRSPGSLYVTANVTGDKLDFRSFEFVVGDNGSYGGFHNLPLKPGATYRIGYFVLSRGQTVPSDLSSIPYSEAIVVLLKSPEDSDSQTGGGGGSGVGLYVGIAVAVVAALVIAAVLLLLWRRGKIPIKRSKKDDAFTGGEPLKAVETQGSSAEAGYISMSGVPGTPPQPLATPVMPSPKPKPRPVKAKSEIAAVKPMVDKPAPAKKPKPAAKPLKLNGGAGPAQGAVYANYEKEEDAIYANTETSVPLGKLVEHVLQGRGDGAKKFKKEFEDIPQHVKRPREVGKIPGNFSKNRFKNIFPYDDNRIELQHEPGHMTDYINASYIDDPNGNKKVYIAAQGPTPGTLADFWRLVWQEKVHTVVMVARLVEDGRDRCAKYWPGKEEETATFGPVTVSLTSDVETTTYTTRLMTATHAQTGEVREVRQLHYTKWPDHGVPNYGSALLALREAAFAPDVPRPVLIHCSAGVGRTGTLISLDLLLQQGRRDGMVNIRELVFWLRSQRMNMVQSLDQYLFLWDTILEHFTVGKTNVEASEFRDEMRALQNTSDGETRYDKQFRGLEVMKKTITASEVEPALFPENHAKNRDPKILPRNRARPILRVQTMDESEYINAVFVDGYMKKDAYIATQMPLPSTVGDFWKLVADFEVYYVVMLNDPDPNDQTSPAYWPEGEAVTHGSVTVEVKKKTRREGYVERHILVTDSSDGEQRDVKHLQLLGWPRGQHVPPSTAALVKVLDTVYTWRQQHLQQLREDQNCVVLAQCSNGVEQCGVYLALSVLVERLKVEREVDVYQAVKNARLTRPEFIPDMEQYKFLYKFMGDYMGGFETYANFRQTET